MFVVDASMTLAWCFDDETTETTDSALRRLLLEGAIAPAHWPLEVANGLRYGEKRSRLNRSKLSIANRCWAISTSTLLRSMSPQPCVRARSRGVTT